VEHQLTKRPEVHMIGPSALDHILDFKQVFRFDSPQIFQILKFLRKNADTGEDLSKESVVMDRVISHAFELSVFKCLNFS